MQANSDLCPTQKPRRFALPPPSRGLGLLRAPLLWFLTIRTRTGTGAPDTQDAARAPYAQYRSRTTYGQDGTRAAYGQDRSCTAYAQDAPEAQDAAHAAENQDAQKAPGAKSGPARLPVLMGVRLRLERLDLPMIDSSCSIPLRSPTRLLRESNSIADRLPALQSHLEPTASPPTPSRITEG